LAHLYELHAPAIFRYAYRRLGDPEQAEDIRAEVFLRMIEGIERYEERGSSIEAWLYRIAHDRIIDQRRRVQPLPLEEWGHVCEGPEENIDQHALQEEVQQSLQSLTERQRTVIAMRFWQDLSIREIAQQLKQSEGAVKLLQHRGMKQLARTLREPQEGKALRRLQMEVDRATFCIPSGKPQRALLRISYHLDKLFKGEVGAMAWWRFRRTTE
ncbi:sigma-70 family RNA polymerase sigma factor, partial [Candidatus Gracilibacteria bacterium]|nr:sigma-70 family RNA polymerase sigma factor [Candidatus Gracilibacteria bacterium]